MASELERAENEIQAIKTRMETERAKFSSYIESRADAVVELSQKLSSERESAARERLRCESLENELGSAKRELTIVEQTHTQQRRRLEREVARLQDLWKTDAYQAATGGSPRRSPPAEADATPSQAEMDQLMALLEEEREARRNESERHHHEVIQMEQTIRKEREELERERAGLQSTWRDSMAKTSATLQQTRDMELDVRAAKRETAELEAMVEEERVLRAQAEERHREEMGETTRAAQMELDDMEREMARMEQTWRESMIKQASPRRSMVDETQLRQARQEIDELTGMLEAERGARRVDAERFHRELLELSESIKRERGEVGAEMEALRDAARGVAPLQTTIRQLEKRVQAQQGKMATMQSLLTRHGLMAFVREADRVPIGGSPDVSPDIAKVKGLFKRS